MIISNAIRTRSQSLFDRKAAVMRLRETPWVLQLHDSEKRQKATLSSIQSAY